MVEEEENNDFQDWSRLNYYFDPMASGGLLNIKRSSEKKRSSRYASLQELQADFSTDFVKKDRGIDRLDKMLNKMKSVPDRSEMATPLSLDRQSALLVLLGKSFDQLQEHWSNNTLPSAGEQNLKMTLGDFNGFDRFYQM